MKLTVLYKCYGNQLFGRLEFSLDGTPLLAEEIIFGDVLAVPRIFNKEGLRKLGIPSLYLNLIDPEQEDNHWNDWQRGLHSALLTSQGHTDYIHTWLHGETYTAEPNLTALGFMLVNELALYTLQADSEAQASAPMPPGARRKAVEAFFTPRK